MARVHLNHRLVLEAESRVSDGAGGYDKTWEVIGTLWADLRARTGRETVGEETTLSQTGYKITVRAAPYGSPSRPVAGQRLRDGTRVFSITSVAERDPQGRYLTCFAEEEVAL